MSASKADWVAHSKPLVFAGLIAPLMWMLWAGLSGRLGPDPSKALVDYTGLWTFRMLLLCLAMTPLRYLTRRSFWIRYRRMLGLFAFFYALVHVSSYVFLLFGAQWADIAVELSKRPYVIVGITAFFLLLPLALTSTHGWQRRLRTRWVMLHRLIYPASILALVHFAWVKKLGFQAIWPYAAVLALLLGIRVWRWRQRLS